MGGGAPRHRLSRRKQFTQFLDFVNLVSTEECEQEATETTVAKFPSRSSLYFLRYLLFKSG